MSFIFISNSLLSKAGQTAVKNALEKKLGRLRGAVELHRSPSFSVVGAVSIDQHPMVSVFRGYAFYNGKLYLSARPPDSRIVRDIVSNVENVDGGFAAAVADIHEDTLKISGDILGQNIINIYEADGEFLISDDIALARKILRLAGVVCKPSIDNLLVNVTYLSGFGRIGPVSNVRLLDRAESIVFDRANGLRSFTAKHLPDLFHAEQRYDTLLKSTAKRIADNSIALADFTLESGYYSIADLSGGVDSRLVWAGLIGSNRHHEIKAFNVNSYITGRSPDRIVGARISDRFGLEFGLAPTEGRNSTTIRNSRRQFDLGSKLAYGVGHFQGLLPYAYDDFGEVSLDKFLRVGGYCGEHTRAPGPNLYKLINGSVGREQLSMTFLKHCTKDGGNNGSCFLTRHGFDRVKEIFDSFFNSDEISELSLDQVNVAVYVENRSRYHFGLRTQNANNFRGSASTLAVADVLKLHGCVGSYRDQFNNRISYDLICELAGVELANLPLADDFWRAGVLKGDLDHSAEAVRSGDFEIDKNHVLDPIKLEANGKYAKSRYSTWRTESQVDVDEPTLVARFLLDVIGVDDELWFWFDRAAISRLVEHFPKSEPERMNALRLLAMLTFYAELDECSAVEEVIDWNIYSDY